MSRKLKRRFLLSLSLALFIKSNKVNADLFAEGFMLDPLPQKPPKCRPYNPYRAKFPVWRRAPKTMLEARKNNGFKSISYYSPEFDCKFYYGQIQRKFRHAFAFGIEGNWNIENGKLFIKILLDHMRKADIKKLGIYHDIKVFHYLDPVSKLNVMINSETKCFLSAWELSDEQLTHVLKDGKLGGG